MAPDPLEETPTIRLRDTAEADLPLAFEWQRDPVANRMAAFTAKDPADREGYMAKWTKLLADPTIISKTILLDGRPVGTIAKFELEGRPNVTYWIDRAYWGRGFATHALSLFLGVVPIRPLYASAAKDNVGSLRVLEKCGFRVTGVKKGFANARGRKIEEVMLELK
jgi:RimJ/RimL family protein N-acetyltransferase